MRNCPSPRQHPECPSAGPRMQPPSYPRRNHRVPLDSPGSQASRVDRVRRIGGESGLVWVPFPRKAILETPDARRHEAEKQSRPLAAWPPLGCPRATRRLHGIDPARKERCGGICARTMARQHVHRDRSRDDRMPPPGIVTPDPSASSDDASGRLLARSSESRRPGYR